MGYLGLVHPKSLYVIIYNVLQCMHAKKHVGFIVLTPGGPALASATNKPQTTMNFGQQPSRKNVQQYT